MAAPLGCGFFSCNSSSVRRTTLPLMRRHLTDFYFCCRCSITPLIRCAKNLNHLTLPEIKDFNALDDMRCSRYFVKRYNGSRTLAISPIFAGAVRFVLFDCRFSPASPVKTKKGRSLEPALSR